LPATAQPIDCFESVSTALVTGMAMLIMQLIEFLLCKMATICHLLIIYKSYGYRIVLNQILICEEYRINLPYKLKDFYRVFSYR
jgi:hypothetical protein